MYLEGPLLRHRTLPPKVAKIKEIHACTDVVIYSQ